MNQNIKGDGFSLRRHPSLHSYFKRRMAGFQRDILGQVHSARSVYVPELIRRARGRRRGRVDSKRLSSRFSEIDERWKRIKGAREFAIRVKGSAKGLKVGRSPKGRRVKSKKLMFYFNGAETGGSRYKHVKYAPSLFYSSKSKGIGGF